MAEVLAAILWLAPHVGEARAKYYASVIVAAGTCYKIDPLLFSPAVVTLVNVDTGRWHRFGRLCPDVIQQSFAT